MAHLHVDIETYSDLDLIQVGTYRYATHPSTEIMLISHSIGREKVINIDMTLVDTDADERTKLTAFVALLDDVANIKWAHNAQFETTLFQHTSNSPVMGRVKFKEWRCTMVLSHGVSLLGALKFVGDVLKIPERLRKMTEGRRLITKFCKQRTPSKHKPHLRCTRETDPEDWALFITYCNNDVEAEREIHRRLKKWDLPEHEWNVYHLDQKINRTGLPIDRELVDAAIRTGDQESLALKESVLEKYGFSITSTTQIRNWLIARGCDIDNTQKATLQRLLKTDISDDVRYVILARLDANKASVKKYHALQRTVQDDDRVRGCFQYGGAARTLRWAGRIYQPQNLARGNLKPYEIPVARSVIVSEDAALINLCYGSANDVLPSLVRSAIRAPDGKVIVVADLASIESIMVAWACNSTAMLDRFRAGIDPYKDFAAYLYKIKYEDVTKEQRTYTKPVYLGGCYQLGAKGLVSYADGFGVDLSIKEAQTQIDAYRKSHPDVVDFWHQLDRAARRCIKYKKPQTVTHFTFSMDGPFMRVSLPSGRSISYLRPHIKMCPAPWDKKQMIPTICYEGMDQKTNRWGVITTHAGKICENIIQAIARDVLATGLVNTDVDKLLEIIGHVHDEIMVLADDNDDTALTRLIKYMTTLPDWCSDVPISAEGFTSPFYLKD